MSDQPVELDPDDYIEYDEDGFQVPQATDELPFDEALCQCGASIGWYYWEDEDEYGRPRGGTSFATTFRLPDGRLVCEDCCLAYEEGTLDASTDTA